MAGPPTSTPPPVPTGLAQKWLRYLLGFGVGVVVGLGPFLGTVGVPLFAPLARLIPVYYQEVAFPISGFCTALAAVALQFYAEDRISHNWLRRAFAWTTAALLVLAFAFLLLRLMLVVSFPVKGAAEEVPILISWQRTESCPCRGLEDVECLKQITIEKAAVESCWGARRIALAAFALIATYTLLTTGLGALISLVLLREVARQRQRSQ